MNKEQYISIVKWQDETFGKASGLSKINHLVDEIEELRIDITFGNNEDKRLEFADCFLLLFGAAASEGMSYEDIVNCIDEKMEINKKRKWGKPNANGVVNHIKE